MINLTQHTATPDQIAAGVVDLPANERSRLGCLLTVDALPTTTEILGRCANIADLAAGFPTAMIGGAPWMMAALERALLARAVVPMYSFSVRESVEEITADGSVRKVAIFRHRGFIEAVK